MSAKEILITTRTRDEAIDASVILADGIESDRIKSHKTKILIVGQDGKSLIVDAVARHLSDHHSAYKMPADRFVEGNPLAAMDCKAKRKISFENTDCAITLTHIWDHYAMGLRLETPRWISTLSGIFRKPAHESIFFVTTFEPSFVAPENKEHSFSPDISIEFNTSAEHEKEKGWGRSWKITINNAKLLTPAMTKAFESLERYQQPRQATIRCYP